MMKQAKQQSSSDSLIWSAVQKVGIQLMMSSQVSPK